MKKTKNLIIIGVVVFLAVAAGAYFTMGQDYQGRATIEKNMEISPFMYNVEEKDLINDVSYDFAKSPNSWVNKIRIIKVTKGCKDKKACNYNKDVMANNSSACVYPEDGYDCLGEPTEDDIEAAQRYLDSQE